VAPIAAGKAAAIAAQLPTPCRHALPPEVPPFPTTSFCLPFEGLPLPRSLPPLAGPAALLEAPALLADRAVLPAAAPLAAEPPAAAPPRFTGGMMGISAYK